MSRGGRGESHPSSFRLSTLRVPPSGLIKVLDATLRVRLNSPAGKRNQAMCLFPTQIKNPRYLPNKKNSGSPPTPEDERKRYIEIPCGQCSECMKNRAREWRVRIEWENSSQERSIFTTLTFDGDALLEIEKEKNTNEGVAKLIEKFRKRWYKKYKEPLRHWLVTELGEKNERIHLHGVLWTQKKESEIAEIWGYGRIEAYEQIRPEGVKYITKYVYKSNEKDPKFRGKVFASKGIGAAWFNSIEADQIKYQGEDTRLYIRTNDGFKCAIPEYYKKKKINPIERGMLWSIKLNKGEKYIKGLKYNMMDGEEVANYMRYTKQRQDDERTLYRDRDYKKEEYDKEKQYQKTIEKFANQKIM